MLLEIIIVDIHTMGVVSVNNIFKRVFLIRVVGNFLGIIHSILTFMFYCCSLAMVIVKMELNKHYGISLLTL